MLEGKKWEEEFVPPELLENMSDLFQIKSEIVLIKSDFVLRVSHYFLPCRNMRSFA